jgi:hypothetical protein
VFIPYYNEFIMSEIVTTLGQTAKQNNLEAENETEKGPTTD